MFLIELYNHSYRSGTDPDPITQAATKYATGIGRGSFDPLSGWLMNYRIKLFAKMLALGIWYRLTLTTRYQR